MEEQNLVSVNKTKKGRLIKAVTGLGRMIYQVFKDYPVTMAAIILAALIGAVLIDLDSINLDEDTLEKLAVFFLLTAVQTIMFEEVFKNKIVVRIGGYMASLAISAFMVYCILSTESDYLFGTDTDTVIEIATRILFVYLVALDVWAVYHMYRRLEEDFEVYCTKAFLGLVKANFIYLLFAVGLAIIIWIFNELIFDTDDFMAQVELFLAGGIYVPMCLKAISAKGEKHGKFAKLCVVYVLQSMLLIAFAIIYIYIIKIFVTDTVPSNQVFNILAFLFAIGMPIWTMVHGMKEEENVLSKVAEFVPYAFIPFIILQCWSMGIRIKEYGYTVSRYSAVLLIIGESVYFILYALYHIKRKKQVISYILFILILIAAFGLIIPWTSYDDVVIRSQTKRLEKMLKDVDKDESLKSAIKSAYRTIDRVGYKGKKALDKKFTKSEIETIEEYSEYEEWGRDSVYLRYYAKGYALDITGYNRLYKVSKCNNDRKKDSIVVITVNLADGETVDYEVDLSELTAWSIENNSTRNSDSFSIEGREKVRIDDKRDLYITEFTLYYYTDTKEITHLTLTGYVLERD
ncbi:MAG: DUF4153 domain-containing protein [Lachnospiraceae bacterium]|nr:DUF4153 domain-containing protein [Lachnospiraceae bacterium]